MPKSRRHMYLFDTFPRLAEAAPLTEDFPMRISDEALDQFIEIYKEEFGEEMARAEAAEMATRLVALYKLLARPLPGGDSDYAASCR